MTLPSPLYSAPSASADARRLLLISPAFPPCAEVGALRWQKLAHVAAARGWALDVITGAALPGERADDATLQLLPAGTRVWTIPLQPVLAERVRRGVWRSLKALIRPQPQVAPGPVSAQPPSVGQASDSFASSMVREHRARNHFQAWLNWCREVTALARLIAHDHAPSFVVTSGPPHMAHEAGRQVAAALGVPLALDLRDPWCIDHAEPLDLRGNTWRTRTATFEASCCHAAQLIIANTGASADLLRERYPDLVPRIMVAMNGADPEVRSYASRSNGFVIAHAGNLYGGRDPRVLFRGIRQFLDSTAGARAAVRVEFVGGQKYGGVPLTDIAAAEGISDVFASRPPLPRTEALRFMGQATVLVVLPQDWSFSVPAKVFEYIQFDAWLLVLSRRTDAASQLLATTSADLVAPDDAGGIAALLGARYRMWNAGERPAAINADGRFDRDSQGNALFDRLEQLAR